MQIAPNCTRILDQWGLLEEVISLGVVPDNLVMKDAVNGDLLTTLDLRDAERRYGFPYVVIHRSDLHATLLRACQRSGVELVTSVKVTGYEQAADGSGATVIFDGGQQTAPVVIAADGLSSVARQLLSDDEPVSSSYVAYRGAIPIEQADNLDIRLTDVTVFVGPHCHFVRYPLRQGEMLNQVAVFQSPRRWPARRTGAPRRAGRCLCRHRRGGAQRSAADVAGPLVADVRP